MLFVRDDAVLIPEAFEVLEGLDDLSVFDMDRVEGRAEAAVHSVTDAPSVLVLDNDGREIAAWRGGIPDREALRSLLSN